MKAYHYKEASGEGTISLVEVAFPEPGLGEVLIRVEAASVNYRDVLMLAAAGRGELVDRIPLSDVAGTVEAAGPSARRWTVGSRVVAGFMPGWIAGPFQKGYAKSTLGGLTVDGVLAEYIVLPETALVGLPEHLSFVEAASLPCAAVTAWNGLFVRAGFKAGDTLLIQGTGGVALFALQISVAVGARAIVISSSDDKLARAKAMGAAVLVNYRERPEWDVAVMEATGGEGATHILELGGKDTYERSVRSVATGGTIVQIGVLSGNDPTPHLRRLMWENANIVGLTGGSVEHLAAVVAFMSEHAIRPVTDTTFAFDEAPQALERLRRGAHFGKFVVVLR